MTIDSDPSKIPFEIDGKNIEPRVTTGSGWNKFINKMHKGHPGTGEGQTEESQPATKPVVRRYESSFAAHVSQAEDEKEDRREEEMRKAMGLRDD